MTDIMCKNCGHIRETTGDYPTLVSCEECGSWNIEYIERTGWLHQ